MQKNWEKFLGYNTIIPSDLGYNNLKQTLTRTRVRKTPSNLTKVGIEFGAI